MANQATNSDATHMQQMQQTQNVGGAALAQCDTRSRHVNDTSQRSDWISSEVSVAGVISVWKRVAGMEVDFPEDLPTACERIKHQAIETKTVFVSICKALTPLAILIFLVAWATFAVCGILIFIRLQELQEETEMQRILSQARLQGSFFEEELGRALNALYTVEFLLHSLSGAGDGGAMLSLPSQVQTAPLMSGVKSKSHRNLTRFDTAVVQAELLKLLPLVKLHAPSVLNIQLAPLGIVTAIVPLAPNIGAIGHDLFEDVNRVDGAVAAVESDSFTVSGPVSLVQGGYAMIGRLPVFTKQGSVEGAMTRSSIAERLQRDIKFDASHDKEDFWGFITVLNDFDTLINASGLPQLALQQNLKYRIHRRMAILATDGSTSDQNSIIASSLNSEVDNKTELVTLGTCCTAQIRIPGNFVNWTLTLAPKEGFEGGKSFHAVMSDNRSMASVVFAVSFVFVSLLLMLWALNKRHHTLLYSMIPKRAVARLVRGEQVIEYFKEVTIFFSDLVGFTTMSSNMHPVELFGLLNDLYSGFDRLVQKHGVTKVETIGDAYFVIGGAPDRSLHGHVAAKKVTEFALDAMEFVSDFMEKRQNAGKECLEMRCGMASGPVVAGVLGTTVPKFSFWGDTVNIASRMESTSLPGKLQIDEHTSYLLQTPDKDGTQFPVSIHRRNNVVDVKGKGEMQTWWVTRQVVMGEA